MWDREGIWRPEDYSLHNTYHRISNRPTEVEKVQYIDNLCNTILERSKSKANFSDLRAEIVDHYVSELGDDFIIDDGISYRQKVHDYHKAFGGHCRIKEIADNFYKTKHQLVVRQFRKWFMEYWPVHLAVIPFAYLVYVSLAIEPFLIALVLMVLSICVYEGVKYHRDRKIRSQVRNGDSSINFFFRFKLELFSLIWVPLYSLNIGPDSRFFWLNYMFILAGLYLIPWLYYYHLNICKKRIAPLLDHYKAQMI